MACSLKAGRISDECKNKLQDVELTSPTGMKEETFIERLSFVAKDDYAGQRYGRSEKISGTRTDSVRKQELLQMAEIAIKFSPASYHI